MTDQSPSQKPGLRDQIINALGQIATVPPIAHRRAQADNVLALLYREWPWLRAAAEESRPAPDRKAASTINDTELDQLYAENDRLNAELGDYDRRVEHLTTELAALRAVARGYCPACGRGDAAPTVADWEQQRQRADQAEELLNIAHDTSNKSEAERAQAVERADKAERERDEARQHAAAIAAQRDRLRQRMNHLADRWEYALAVDKPYGRTLRSEISVAPFHPDTSTAIRQYRADDGSQKWAARCWGTDTCDGWLSLDHDTERWAEIARDRHITEAHSAPSQPAPVRCTCTCAGVGFGDGTCTVHNPPELTAQEARDLADQLGTELYRVQDRLAFIAELLDAAEQDGTTTVDISRVRSWLDGPKCGMQLAAEQPGLRTRQPPAVP